MKGVYVHVPFCAKKCGYCDFVSYCGVAAEGVDEYLSALSAEARAVSALSAGVRFNTVYVGGGTPSVLSAEQIFALGGVLKQIVAAPREYTFECNPDSVTGEKLSAMKAIGVNRLSIGAQSFNDADLRVLGRIHTAAAAREKFALIRHAGFDNINLDLIYGIPGQTEESWGATLREALRLGPEHLSLYPLTVEDGTPFSESGVSADGDLQAEMYYSALGILEGAGYVRYEISNFSFPGRECVHNLNYWARGGYEGIGASAVSFKDGVRNKNVSGLAEYVRTASRGIRPVGESEELSGDQRSAERIMLGLRTASGVRLSGTEERFEAPLYESRRAGLVETSPDGLWRLTRRGIYLSNEVFRGLLP
jgi:oxygen-independent coproporphyrinogen-3 oxidase